MTMPVRRDDMKPWRPGIAMVGGDDRAQVTFLVAVTSCLNSNASGLNRLGRAAMLANHAIERMMEDE